MKISFIVSLSLVVSIGVGTSSGIDDHLDPSIEISQNALPFFVTIYYHIEPNHQLFESIESGYFETVSSCLRQMSSDLAALDVHATFCFSWLYNDIVYQRNRDPNTCEIINSDADTGIETFQQIISDNHEIAYHTHPPIAVMNAGNVFYARPNAECTYFDTFNIHRWSGLGADQAMQFEPGIYQFDDSSDDWYGQFIWERTTESLIHIAQYLGIPVRHINGGQKPLFDIMNSYGFGINHPHCIDQARSLMELGLDLMAPECMAFFREGYLSSGEIWSDTTTWYVSYFGSESNFQLYYPDIDNTSLERASYINQGLTFLPVQKKPQASWMSSGIMDSSYYNAEREGSYGGGGIRWTPDTFYSQYTGNGNNPWQPSDHIVHMPSLANQFNSALQQHTMTPWRVNAWGLNHHVVNVMWTDLSGLSDNWGKEIAFLHDISDGMADGVANPPRPDLVRFVTMQDLSDIYDDVMTNIDTRDVLNHSPNCLLFQNYPNPFNSSTTIRFEIVRKGNVTIRVYDILGREIKTILDKELEKGIHSVDYDGTDAYGREIANGIYLYQMKFESSYKVSKMIVLK